MTFRKQKLFSKRRVFLNLDDGRTPKEEDEEEEEDDDDDDDDDQLCQPPYT
jgi:hypothetical protein